MRITSLELTNFRSFRSTQKIDFAPVTLLFGPNSVGKSTVLMALFYVQQILEKGHCDPVQLDAAGDKHIGGFKNLVNGRDLSKRIVIKITCDKKGTIGSTYNQVSELVDQEFGITVDSPAADADKVAVELHIGTSKKTDTAYVACYKVWFDEKLIAELTSDDGLKQPVISYLNYRHQALICDEDAEYESEHGDGNFLSRFQEIVNEPRMVAGDSSGMAYDDNIEVLTHVPIGFKGFAGALPVLSKTLRTSLDFDDQIIFARVHEILSDVVVAPLDNLLELLKDSLCIGPLRVVPDALHQTNPYPQQKDWYTGAAAWDVVGRTGNQILAINHWMGGADRLDLGYSIRNKAIVSRAIYTGGDNALAELEAAIEQFGDELQLTVSKEDLAENPQAEQITLDMDEVKAVLRKAAKRAESQPKATEIHDKAVLWDEINNIEVSSSDIGVGVSQLFPLIVAAVDRQKGIVACEQPELHVHPRVQVGIGDLLTQNAGKKIFLIETHSEHLILRILKRIRQTTDNELPENISPVRPSDVSIVYMEPAPYGTKAKRIEIDEDGEFRQRWPKGFFDERWEELV
jgi:predicted ATPase